MAHKIEKPDGVVSVGLFYGSQFTTSVKPVMPLGLAAAFLAFGKAILAVDRTVTARFEWNFAFFFAIRAYCLVEFLRASTAVPASTAAFSIETHILSLILWTRPGWTPVQPLYQVTCLIS